MYEIWLGYYDLGQGHHGSTKPEKVATVAARSFKLACYIFELESTLASMKKLNDNPKEYFHEPNLRWDYDVQKVSQSWIGRYYETEEEAQKSFKV